MRVVMRGFVIVLAMVLAVASPGTVLCEMDCAAVGHAAATVAMTPMSVGGSHCDGEQSDLSAHHGNSGGNTKHGAHLHSGMVATVGAAVVASPVNTFSDFAIASVDFGAPVTAHAGENSWNNNSSPPINSSSVLAPRVLRI